ncbi:MAG TPA: DUF3306 domain-containing protein [Burkholderiales bacterium]|nr:DUF3306 domain-containing protein [Burkholderiales bacterium]
MAQDPEPFFTRWSRRKRAEVQSQAEPRPAAPAEAPPPELPPIGSLTPESDFSAFMHKQVDEKLRRAALSKLFSDPAFNVVDGLDDYAEDFTQLETLAEGAAAGLKHAKRTLLGRDPDAPAQAEAGEGAKADADAAQAPPPDAEAEEATHAAQAPPPAADAEAAHAAPDDRSAPTETDLRKKA